MENLKEVTSKKVSVKKEINNSIDFLQLSEASKVSINKSVDKGTKYIYSESEIKKATIKYDLHISKFGDKDKKDLSAKEIKGLKFDFHFQSVRSKIRKDFENLYFNFNDKVVTKNNKSTFMKLKKEDRLKVVLNQFGEFLKERFKNYNPTLINAEDYFSGINKDRIIHLMELIK